VTPFQLHVDLFPSVGDLIAECNESVIFGNHPSDEQKDDYDDKNEKFHGKVPFKWISL
jgi:hypothetical protein